MRYWAIKVTFVVLDWCISAEHALRVEQAWRFWFIRTLDCLDYVYFRYNIWVAHDVFKNFYRRRCRVNRLADDLWFKQFELDIEGAEVLSQQERREEMLYISVLRKKTILRALPVLARLIERRFLIFDNLAYDLRQITGISLRDLSLYKGPSFVYLPVVGSYNFKTPILWLSGFSEEAGWSVGEVKTLCVDLGHIATSDIYDFRILCHRKDMEAALYLM